MVFCCGKHYQNALIYIFSKLGCWQIKNKKHNMYKVYAMVYGICSTY